MPRTSLSDLTASTAAFSAAIDRWLDDSKVIAPAILIVGITFAELSLLSLIWSYRIDFYTSAVRQVLSGTPDARAFAQRLLGPLTIAAIARSTGLSYAVAIYLFQSFCLLLSNIVFYFAVRPLYRAPMQAVGWVAIYAAAVTVVHDRWSLTWDYYDLVFLTALMWLIRARSGLVLIVLLFLIDLLNRESALYIALWVCLDAVHAAKSPGEGPKRHWSVDRGRFAVGCALLVGGAIYIKFARDILFHAAKAPGVVAAAPRELFGNQLVLGDNIREFIGGLVFRPLYIVHLGVRAEEACLRTGQIYFKSAAFAPLLLIGVIVFFVTELHKQSQTGVKLLLVMLAALIGLTLFSDIQETRVFIDLVPFALFALALRHGAPAGRLPIEDTGPASKS